MPHGPHMTWAEAAEIALYAANKQWHSAVEIFDLIVAKKVKEPSQARGRTIESIRTALISQSRKEKGRFLWDCQLHKFCLKPGLDSKELLRRAESEDISDGKQPPKPSLKFKLLVPPEVVKTVPKPSPKASPTLETQKDTFLPQNRYKEQHSHGNLSFFNPIVPTCPVSDLMTAPMTVIVSSEQKRDRTAPLSPTDSRRHCVALPPCKSLRTHQYFSKPRRKRLKIAPIEFNPDYFPSIAFHYLSKPTITSPATNNSWDNQSKRTCQSNSTCSEPHTESVRNCADTSPGDFPPSKDKWLPFSTNVFFHIHQQAGQVQKATPILISPDAIWDSSESESELDEPVTPEIKPKPKPKPVAVKVKQIPKEVVSKKSQTINEKILSAQKKDLKSSAPSTKKRKVAKKLVSVKPALKAATAKPSLKSTSKQSQTAVTQRDMQTMLVHQDSPLSTCNLRSILTIESFQKLPPEQRKTVAQFLPSMDQEGDGAGGVTAKRTAFSNVFFAAALRDWQKCLKNGEFTLEYKARVRAEERKRMVETAANVVPKTPRLIFPPEDATIPRLKEPSFMSNENKVLQSVNNALMKVKLAKEDEDAMKSQTELECNEMMNGRDSDTSLTSPPPLSETEGKAKRVMKSLSRRSIDIEAAKPRRGRPRKQDFEDHQPWLPNGIVAYNSNSPSPQRGSSPSGRDSPSPYSQSPKIRSGGNQSPAARNRLFKPLRGDLLSPVPPHIAYKEIQITLEQFSALNTGTEVKKRRSQSEPLKRQLARHLKFKSIPVYHDHFAILNLSHHPSEFKTEVESKPIVPNSESEVGICQCKADVLLQCSKCNSFYHKDCSVRCLLCSNSLL